MIILEYYTANSDHVNIVKNNKLKLLRKGFFEAFCHFCTTNLTTKRALESAFSEVHGPIIFLQQILNQSNQVQTVNTNQYFSILCICVCVGTEVQAISWRSCNICVTYISNAMSYISWFLNKHDWQFIFTKTTTNMFSQQVAEFIEPEQFHLSNVVRLSCTYVRTKKADASRNSASSLLHKSHVVSCGTLYIVRHSSPVVLQENANNTKGLTTHVHIN